MPEIRGPHRRIVVLGSTGSIGRQALDVIRANPHRFELVGLAAGRDAAGVAAQASEFAGVATGIGTAEAIHLAALPEADIVLNGIVGAAGLKASIAALEAGKVLALANKESLVAGGEACFKAAQRGGGSIVPVDSEHAALAQCLDNLDRTTVARIVITASGGPFRERSDLREVTPEEALAHPTWSMGPKVTVDSATLMNKGLEVIEAHHLFGFSYDDIAVVVHPQSIVHGMVELQDGSTLLQAAPPDMRIPIQAALGGDRFPSAIPVVDLTAVGTLTFQPVDTARFPSVALAYDAGRRARSYPAVLNAANEVAVNSFLQRRIPFEDIPNVVESVLDAHTAVDVGDVDAVLAVDDWRVAAPAGSDSPGGSGMTLGVVLFIGWILLMVMIHESGHFLMAKLFHFRANQFFLGFGPTLWSTTKGETEYGVKALPLGGFVKIVGMNPYEQVDAADEPRSYTNKPRWQRALVLVAGSATHWVLAFVTLLIAAMVLGFPNGQATNQVALVQQTLQGRPTAASDLSLDVGDRIVAIGGNPVSHWSQIRSYIRLHPGENVDFSILHDGQRHDVAVQLGNAIVRGGERIVAYAPAGQPIRHARAGERLIGYLGVQPKLMYQKYAFIGAARRAASLTWDYTKYSVQQVGALFHTIFSGELWSALSGHGSRGPGQGPVSIYGAGRIAGQTVADHQYLDLIGLLVGLTIFLGIMNLLPLPPLDGGHLAVVAYESITRRTVDLRKLIPVAAAVISFFVLIFIASLYLDIIRPLNLPL